MRVLQLVNMGFEYGGAEKSVRLLAEGLAARGHEVRIAAVDRPADGQPAFAHHLVPAIGGGPLRSALGYLWHQPAYRGLRRILAEFEPDIVHFHTTAEFSPAALAAARNYPSLLTARVAEGGGYLVDAEPRAVGAAAQKGGVALVHLAPAGDAGLEQLFFDLTSGENHENDQKEGGQK